MRSYVDIGKQEANLESADIESIGASENLWNYENDLQLEQLRNY